jgi:hypothetical protein
MAIYHMSIKNISRAKGKTAIAAAAYRAGTILTDNETGITHNYVKKSEVKYTEIILPEHAPAEYATREILWNEVQKIETQDRARLAREWEVAIPNELDLDQAKTLIRNFARSLVKEGMCVDLALHWKDGNHHAHIMGTTRPIGNDGKWAAKERKGYKLDAEGKKIPVIDPKTGHQKIGARGRKMWQRETVQANDWNRREKVEEWRKRWADCCNKYLAREQQIDHRSYERQGVTQLPTVHEGYAARLMEQRGTVSDLCQLNRNIVAYNHITALYSKSKQELKLLEQEIAKAKEPDFRELRMDGCRLAERLLHKYGNQWAEKRAKEDFDEKTKDISNTISRLEENIKEIEAKYKKKALKKRGWFAKMLGSDGMTDDIREELDNATRYLRYRLDEERRKLPSIPDTDSYNRYWYNIYKSNDADRKMTFAMYICEKIGVQNDQNQDYLQLKKVYDKFAPIHKKIEQKKRRQELAQYYVNYRTNSRSNEYTID